MKHWDGRDRDDAVLLRLSRQERSRLRKRLAEVPAHRRHEPLTGASVIGLVLSLGMLAGLAWMLAPAPPVSPDIIN